MKEFPSLLNVLNKEKFKDIYEERVLCYLRRDIYEHILSHEEKDYFSLDEFNKKIENMELVKKLVDKLIPELEKLNWKCKYSYGDTALFIYSTERPPDNCW